MSEDNKTADNAALDDLRNQLEALKSKNKELIAEKQKAKQAADAAREAAEEAAAEAALKNGDVEAIKSTHAKELKKLQDQLSQRDTDLRTIRVDNAIAQELGRSNVHAHAVPLLEAFLKQNVQYENGEASIQSKPIPDYIKEFLGSEIGAHYVRAPENSGAGAVGSKAKATHSKWTKETFNMTEFGQLARENPEEANAVAAQLGLPYRV